jgi:hypothetical protein
VASEFLNCKQICLMSVDTIRDVLSIFHSRQVHRGARMKVSLTIQNL